MSTLTIATPTVTLINGQPKTTSIDIAKTFTKRHCDVLRAIENLIKSDDFSSTQFCVHVQNIEIGKGATRESKYYEITRDGFALLAMGFTGLKALQFKISYIQAFNAMEAKLTQGESYLPSIVARASEAGLQVASQLAASMSDQVHNLSMSKRFFVNIDMHDKKVQVREMTDDESVMRFTEMDDLLKPLVEFYRKREIGLRAPRIRKTLAA